MPLPSSRVPAAVHEADGRVRETLAAAEARAREIVAAGEAAREAIRAEAEEAGRRAGLARAGALLAEIAAARDRRLAEVEREVATLALEVAGGLLGRALATSEEAVVELAARAIAAARDRREVVLRVHPDDARTVRAAERRLGALLARAALDVREDPAVGPGGAVVETEAGWVDARVETQLSELARALEEELR